MFGLIKKYSVHMCSEVKGVLTLKGAPVEGALIKRNLLFANKVEKEDQVTTGYDGSFYLPEVVIDSKKPMGSPIRKFRSSRQLCFLDLFIQKPSVLII
ncbi:hypothetical protein I6F65_21220 [Pseudoalteromonas sp. SWXJZ94C]|uniref:DUF6795 domain-containing protein n=1 Tax=Pseudoalteromonas sp. SWXJZ94C TaxID=2792065 RepID=UPI0018CD2B84|nr:DUF6795 domain-containing protein [Pseudoalteromonas sp. SWXJZ94C]MBH0059457.1 hypothetical protein [Pseudoalteromonas sp. SWXJZ94C]